MVQVLLTEQAILPTTDSNSIISAKSNYANYHTISTTNGFNALIDIMENAVVLTDTGDGEKSWT